MLNETKKIPVCATCGSRDVKADSFSAWDIESQSWESVTIFDKGHVCENCGGECSIKWEDFQNIAESKESADNGRQF